MSLRPTREAATRELLAAIELATPRLAPPPPCDGLDRFWTPEEIAEVTRFRAGGPLPVTAGALELLAIHIELDHTV
jgi:hypothetical protein